MLIECFLYITIVDDRGVGIAIIVLQTESYVSDEYKDFSERMSTRKPELKIESFPIGDYYKVPTGRILDHVL